ncbi:hypothetical protein [Acetobacter persici]|uniref:Uncharacterized protein n=1 Tax=Acetobacter persici TaxID=1076596 RepID=A0A6V8IEA9_9PROT|nr:hypothetical protein [Acetobacter persici]OUI87434.1 hypothetical protein HK19_01460 [Acetobacter persici]GFE94926.1 hypothetical protein DmAi_29850 [Acetobacter persici]
MADFVFKRGTTFLVTCINQDAQGAPVDLGGAVIAAELRDAQNALIAPLVPMAVADQLGTYTLTYPGDTSGWPLGTLRTDVRISDLNGTIKQTNTVTITIVDRVTQ